MRDVRDWMRDLMRRRSRRGPNNSESTGKSGQELPQNQPAPLRPSYPEPVAVRETQSKDVGEPATAPAKMSAPAPTKVAAEVAVPAAEPEKRMVVETQPDSLATPPGEQAAISPK